MNVSHIVIGVGNAYRRDDGVGLYVTQLLREAAPRDCAVHDAPGEGVALMQMWEGAGRVTIVDAVRSVGKPGEIVCIDAAQQLIPSDLFHYSTHAFSVAEAIELSRVLGTLPGHVVLYGIVGSSFAGGRQLTPEVAESGRRIARMILDQLDAP